MRQIRPIQNGTDPRCFWLMVVVIGFYLSSLTYLVVKGIGANNKDEVCTVQVYTSKDVSFTKDGKKSTTKEINHGVNSKK